MAILAQRLLDAKAFNDSDPGSAFENLVRYHLNPKTPLEKQATRIVYQDDLYSALCEMVAAEQIDFGMVCRHARMPADRIWLEWHDAKTEGGNLVDFGALVIPNPSRDSAGEFPLWVIMVNQGKTQRTDTVPQVSCVFATKPPPYEAGVKTDTSLIWCIDDRLERETTRLDIWRRLNALAIRTLTFALFLLQQPKLIDEVKVEHSKQVNKKRAAKGKHELISYTSTSLKFHILGSNIERHARQGKRVDGLAGNIPDGVSATGSGKRYHYVIGHFRCYHRGEENEFLSWIEPHYRGDVSKGVLIRERVLKTA